MPLRVLVVTIVHRPLDARIHARQIRAMQESGWDVTYAAPWSDTGTPRDPDLKALDLPQAVGPHRLRAIRAARRMMQARARDQDLVLLHDPELLISAAGLRSLPPVVWDVHEDVASSLADRTWVPAGMRPALRAGLRLFERWAERRHHLILAETSYAARFRQLHPVVPNLPWVPHTVQPSQVGRAVYLGRISRSRGLEMLLAVADLVAPEVTIELIGYADPDVEEDVSRADRSRRLLWHGFLGNAQALDVIEGATVGLSLLRDEPNFRRSLPTKVAEYMAHGVPVVTTPLEEAVKLISASGGGTIVEFGDVQSAAAAILHYHDSRAARREAGRNGHLYARSFLDWHKASKDFLNTLVAFAAKQTASDERNPFKHCRRR